MFTSIYEKIIAVSMIVYNLISMLLVDPFSQTLSDLGSSLAQHTYLVVWACSSSMYFFIYTHRLMKKMNYQNRYGKYCLLLSCLGIIVAVCIPFYPNDYPILSAWHTNIAIASTITYILTMYHMLYILSHTNYSFFSHVMRSFTTLIFIEGFLFLYNGGVNTILEISFTIAIIIFLPYMLAYEIK